MVKNTITITIDPEMDKKLIDESGKAHRSKSSMVNWILTNYFSDEPKRA